MTTVSIGANTANTFSGIEDAYLALTVPTVNYGLASDLYIHENTTSLYHTVMKFTGLSNIAGPVSVTSAILSIKNRDALTGTVPISAFQLLTPFNVSQVTWNKRDTSNNWTAAGARNSTDAATGVTLCTGVVPATGETFFNMTDTVAFRALVEGWINGTVPNYGILLTPTQVGQVGSLAIKRLGSNEAVTNGNRVYLTVTYTVLTPPSVSVNDINVNNLSGTYTFTVALSGSFALPLTVDYDTADGTSTEPDDYIAISGTLTFAPGESVKTVTGSIVP